MTQNSRRLRWPVPQMAAVVLVGLFALPADAQWTTQTVNLATGWNSVYLEIDPAPAEADILLAGQPIEAVWSFSDDALEGPPNCADNNAPECVPPADSRWRFWVGPTGIGRPVHNLRLIRGGRVYRIKAHAPATLSLTGMPHSGRARWQPGLNLAGFHVATSGSTPTFAAYLAPSPAHSGASVYAINSDGSHTQITNTASTQIAPGVGYWVGANAASRYDGPVDIDSASRRGVAFARSLTDVSIAFENLAASARNVVVSVLPSAPVPGAPPTLPALAGAVPLRWLQYNGGDNSTTALVWQNLTSQGYPLGAAGSPTSQQTLRVQANRNGLTEALLNPDGSGLLYQGLIEISDGAGFRRLLALSTEVQIRAGLYVGDVEATHVSWVTAPASGDADSVTPRPVAAPMAFRVILHRSPTGVLTLLSEVTMFWRPGNEQTQTPGRYVLVTPDCPPAVRSQLQAGSLQNGEPFARRISSVGYVIDHDLPLTGAFGGTISGSIGIAGSHRLNPYKHRYHPDHDCNQVGECYDIGRSISLSFLGEPRNGQIAAGFGDTYYVGDYTETITGLHRDPINVSGRFELTFVAAVPTLNDVQ